MVALVLDHQSFKQHLHIGIVRQTLIELQQKLPVLLLQSGKQLHSD